MSTATTADQIVIAAEITVDSPGFGHLEPMVGAARADLDYAGVTEHPAMPFNPPSALA